MKIYQSAVRKLPGTSYKEIYANAYEIFKVIKRKIKRRAHIRSKYFNKAKVFLGLFWEHLEHKFNNNDKARRLKYYACALDLIQNSLCVPTSKENVDTSSEILHRFEGITKNKELFFVQIKEDKRSGEKFFISVFPK